jgi:formimidoylglutamate deiminase
VDARWTLVHATHLVPEEVRALARSGATVAICTTTEANLGDGLFPLRDYLDAGGHWGVGSDSHISVSPVEELRWLEYGQRLHARRRNIATSATRTSTGESLLHGAVHGGARGSGWDGQGDTVVLDDQAPELASATRDNLVDRWIFSGNRNLVRETRVGGTRVVADGRHGKREQIESRYRVALANLLREPA